jgi:hypothetical protein
MVKRGDLTVDAETDSSGARFITRTSVTRFGQTRSDGPTHLRIDAGIVPLADVDDLRIRCQGSVRPQI